MDTPKEERRSTSLLQYTRDGLFPSAGCSFGHRRDGPVPRACRHPHSHKGTHASTHERERATLMHALSMTFYHELQPPPSDLSSESTVANPAPMPYLHRLGQYFVDTSWNRTTTSVGCRRDRCLREARRHRDTPMIPRKSNKMEDPRQHRISIQY
jgi:hypothetical protein